MKNKITNLLNLNKRSNKIARVCLLLLCVLSCGVSLGGEIFSCTDKIGKVVFTDNIKNCYSQATSNVNSIEKIKIQNSNIHSQYGRSVSKEYYNYAYRTYEEVSGYNIRIIAEKALINKQPKILKKAAKKLETAVSKAIFSFPEHIRDEFDGVKYFLFSGEESRTGGRKGGQWYFRKGNRTSPKFDNSIVIRSAKDYLTFYSEERAAQTASHELSHAYYYYHRSRIYWAVKKAFKNAQFTDLYKNVKYRSGKLIKNGYALTNEREYFAELSKTFNIGNYYSPFNASQLQQYDPLGFSVINDAYLPNM